MSEQNNTPLAAILMGAEPAKPEPTPEPMPDTSAAEPQLTGDLGLTPEQQHAYIQDATTRGTMTQADADALLSRVGEPTADEIAHYADVPDDIAGYRFDYPYGRDVDQSFDHEARELLRDMGVPRWMGPIFAEAWFKAFDQAVTGGMTPATREFQRRASEFNLRGRWGDRYDAKLKSAQSVIDALPEAKRARVIELFEISGLGDDEMVLEHLATQGEIRNRSK